MKYGFYDFDWFNGLDDSKIGTKIVCFNRDCFLPFMKRKTISQHELKILESLTEMVEIMNDHVKEMKIK